MHKLLALALAAALAVPCPAAAEEEAATPKHQFIDKTYVQVPKQVGIYTLEKTSYDAKELGAGVRTLYGVEGAPKELTLSLFAYPQGRAVESEVVDREIAGVEQVIRMQKDYTAIEAGPRTEFRVDAPKPSVLPEGEDEKHEQTVTFTPASEDGKKDPKEAEDERALEEVVQEMAAPTHTSGRRQAFNFLYKGVQTRSVGLVFHRNLYNIKLRVSVPAELMEAADFEAAVDAAARTLVPLVDIQNYGACGDIVIALADDKKIKDKDKAAEDTARRLMREMGRVNRENCAGAEGKTPLAVPEGYERTEIVYPPGTWGG